MERPLGVILAGGQARRMGGGDKGLLTLDGQRILDHVVSRLAPQVAGIAINANGDPARFNAYEMPVIADSVEGYPGPLAGVLAGLDWAHECGAEFVVTAAADTPFFPNDLARRFQTQQEGHGASIVLAATRDDSGKLWRQPTFGLWHVSLRDDLRAALASGLRKVVLWTDKHNAATVEFESVPIDPFFNVNTPNDLEDARLILEQTQ